VHTHDFRIYLAGGFSNSIRALANLREICALHCPDNHNIEVIDILQEPLVALVAGILITPTTVRMSPEPEMQIIGDLSAKAEVLLAFGFPTNNSA